MRMVLLYTLITCYLGLLVHSALAGIYLPKRQYLFLVPPSIGAGDRIGSIHTTLDNDIIKCGRSMMSVLVTPVAPNTDMELAAGLSNNGRALSLTAGVVPNPLSGTRQFKLSLSCKDFRPSRDFLYSSTLWESEITVEALPREADLLSRSDSWIVDRLCPGNDSLSYDVIENGSPGRIDTFGALESLRANGFQGYDVKVSVRDGNSNFLAFDKNTSSLHLTTFLDREHNPSSTHTETLECEISHQGTPLSISPITRDVTINIYDVDDNLPENDEDALKSLNVPTFPPNFGDFFLDVNDLDSIQVTNQKTYRLTSNDTRNFFHLTLSFNETSTPGQPPSTLIRTKVARNRGNGLQTPYQIRIVVEDLTYTAPAGNQSMDGEETKVVFNINVAEEKEDIRKSEIEVNFDPDAAKYSLVSQLRRQKTGYDPVGSLEWMVVHAMPRGYTSLFNVTQEGQVFLLNDQKNIRNLPGFFMPKVKVALSDDRTRHEEFTIKLKIPSGGRSTDKDLCHQSCFHLKTEEACTSACGYGATSGHCSWESSMGTCTPNLETCPDSTCSALEKMNSDICPQDCDPAFIIIRPTPKPQPSSIPLPCTCDSLDDGESECRCDLEIPVHVGSVDGQNGNGTLKRRRTTVSSSPGGCSDNCQVGVAVAVIVVLIIIAIVIKKVAWKKCRDQVQLPSLKHVNSLVSMSAIPSDYVVDDSRDGTRAHVTRKMAPPTSGPWTTQPACGIGGNQELIDDEWEFPRQNLSLEAIIGEGEFGQVMRAAMTPKGQRSEDAKVVAVKMLKPEASGAEYQDLYSEFQMLKEVDHPNVIQMLGVCTQKGPLYIIVEYCELGSLRSFLRASKFKNKESWEEKQQSGNMFTESRAKQDARVLTSRNLFSFAWQISKGMDYLAGLKIVHRDLAARNVLVKEGMLCKISDFGLSRDVYEASIYLQETKGRIPVKWMAPEFLYAQVYTTKSDVWSFGILLWEIVTLGASPYPGIPPERLFHLLSTGYRMDRPEDCPDEMYALMQKCWKSAPEDRPSFAVLRDIIDHILQQNIEYLELPDNSNSGPFDEFQAFRRQVCMENNPRQASPHHTEIGSNGCKAMDNNKEPTSPSSQPTYGNIRNVKKHGGYGNRRDRTAPTSTSPFSSPSSSSSTSSKSSSAPGQHDNAQQMHWHAADDDDSDRESVPESSRLLREDSNKNAAKKLYENNVTNIIHPSNNDFAANLKNGQNVGGGGGVSYDGHNNKLSSSVFSRPRQTVHENLTYV